MNYKIIETDSHLPDLLLFRGINENSDSSVTIYAIGFVGSEESIEQEEVLFDSQETAEGFITDYSAFSANKWCQCRDLTYAGS